MNKIQQIFEEVVPNPKCELNFQSTFQLLVAVVLSAQCTDKRVNEVTASLFKKYPRPEDFQNLTPEILGKEIYSLGFFKTKAKNIIELSKAIMQNYGGKVPNTMEKLVALPGVGGKNCKCCFGRRLWFARFCG